MFFGKQGTTGPFVISSLAVRVLSFDRVLSVVDVIVA